MPHLENSIAEIVTTVWDTVLGLQAEPDDSLHLTSSPDHTIYAGVVQIHGAWDGAIALQCSEALARRADPLDAITRDHEQRIGRLEQGSR